MLNTDDFQCLARPAKRATSNVLFGAWHVATVSNRDDRLTVDIGTVPYDALKRILAMFELADDLR